MKNVISIVPYKIFPAVSGGQKGLALFNEYFARDTSLVCVTVKANDPSKAKGYLMLNVLSDSRLRYINLFYFFRLRSIIRENHGTHLVLEHPYFGWLGVLLKWLTGIRLIIHSHNIEATRWKSIGKWWWRIMWLYEKFTHRNADYNFFIQDDDRKFAIEQYGLKPASCLTITYGIGWNKPPSGELIAEARKKLRMLHNIREDQVILLFNGAFGYQPNLQALINIINELNPILGKIENFNYKIIICGIGIPENISNSEYENMIIAGFVDDIRMYFMGSDIFLNPVEEGGGIKTKLVEALGDNLNVVSTRNGAVGVDPAWCNGKLLISGGDWIDFSKLVVKASTIKADIPPLFFEHFYWGYITRKAAEFIANA
jgi:glycosyltransferase involved in cell wall biosynthesis